jgi:hypothetical protein
MVNDKNADGSLLVLSQPCTSGLGHLGFCASMVEAAFKSASLYGYPIVHITRLNPHSCGVGSVEKFVVGGRVSVICDQCMTVVTQ